jgi:hypothetical protein
MNILDSILRSRSPGLKGVIGGGFVCLLLVTVDQISIRFGLDGSQRIIDDALGGLLAGAIFYSYERHTFRMLSQRLRIIDLTNHHIRNALQPVMLVTYEPDEEKQLKVIDECVRRIDFALREVLPGRTSAPFTQRDRLPDHAWATRAEGSRTSVEN